MATKTLQFASLLASALVPVMALVISAGGCDSGGSTTAPSDVYADLGITLNDLDAEAFTLVSKTKSDVHVLAFWATWCVPCVGELAKFQEIHERLEQKGLRIYGISTDGPDTTSRVPGFASQEGWTFPVLYDPETELLARYNPKGDIPFYVILDADGNILKSHQGYVKGDEVELEKFLEEHLSAE
jgi:peroxiredoxin